jgi:hypothetical protein
VRRAVTLLWVAYGLTFLHAMIVIGDRWLSWPLQGIVIRQAMFELFYAALIYLIASGRYAALLAYTVLLVPRTVTVLWNLVDDWDDNPWLVWLAAISFTLQYLALYWSLTPPGRRWFSGATDLRRPAV